MKGENDKKWVRFGDLKFKSSLRRRDGEWEIKKEEFGEVAGLFGLEKVLKKLKIAKRNVLATKLSIWWPLSLLG